MIFHELFILLIVKKESQLLVDLLLLSFANPVEALELNPSQCTWVQIRCNVMVRDIPSKLFKLLNALGCELVNVWQSLLASFFIEPGVDFSQVTLDVEKKLIVID